MSEATQLHDRILVALQHRHVMDNRRAAEWLLVFELRDGTGFSGKGQRLDAFAMNTYPSHKFQRVGYEIKVSRGDFLNELKNPAKRSWGMSITNEFWFVAPSNVIDKAEVPAGCGLLHLVSDGTKLKVARAAPWREVRDLKLHEMAAILRQGMPQDYLYSKRWQLAGREITNDDLTKILLDDGEQLMRNHISAEVERKVKEEVGRYTASLKIYAEALRRVGVEPPEWMTTGRLRWDTSKWEAETWVKKHVTQGPGLGALHDIEFSLRMMRQKLDEATALVEKAKAASKPKPRVIPLPILDGGEDE